MAKNITEEELFQELVNAYYWESVADDDITAGRIADAVHAKGGIVSMQTIEADMLRRSQAGEFTVVVKRGKNGRDVNVYTKRKG